MSCKKVQNIENSGLIKDVWVSTHSKLFTTTAVKEQNNNKKTGLGCVYAPEVRACMFGQCLVIINKTKLIDPQ